EQSLAGERELEEMVAMHGIDNDGAMEAWRTGLREANGIEAKYVDAGMRNDELGMQLQGAKITVVSPENDIDRFYLGAEADETLRGLSDATAEFHERAAPAADAVPSNISAADFRRL